MVEYRASHTPTALPKKASTEFQRSQALVTGGQNEKKTLESNVQEAFAQQRRVSELRCCNCGRWGSDGSSYVVEGQGQNRRLGCRTATYTAENPAIYGMH